MKAAVLFESPGKLQIVDLHIDDPGPREVKVRIAAAGLCHSDLHYLDRGRPLAGPMVLGHEAAGVVEEVGSAVSYVQPGDHVVFFVVGYCDSCEWCVAGNFAMCDRKFVGRKRGEPTRLRLPDGSPCLQLSDLGAFAEQTLVHENLVARIPSDIPFDRAAIVSCGVPTGVGAVLNAARVRSGATVAVIGCGGIGLNCIQGAVLAGASRIVAIDINDGKLATARSFGATDTINNSAGDALERLGDLLPGTGGVDYSFEALGLQQTYELACTVLRKGGTATLLGVASGTFQIPMDGFAVQGKRIQGSPMGSVHFRRELPHYLELYRNGQLKLDELISNRIPLEQINEGYAAISDGNVARSVVIFD
jgi:S-(hydroxymethyl)glutathione dehydrogenase / alcohol dehydrogenase